MFPGPVHTGTPRRATSDRRSRSSSVTYPSGNGRSASVRHLPGRSRRSSSPQKLLERYLEEHRPQNAPAETVALVDIVLDYYKAHGAHTRSAGSIRTACAYWVDCFGDASIAEATKPPSDAANRKRLIFLYSVVPSGSQS